MCYCLIQMSMIRNLFLKRKVYLDWASAAPVKPEAARAFRRALGAYGNPSSPHADGVTAKRILEEARTTIARLSAVKAASVIFTSGATEANALAIQGRINAMVAQGKRYEDLHILYLPTMHSSALKTIAALAERGVRTDAIPLKDWRIDLPAFAKLLCPETALVCVDAVCGETGTRFDTRGVRTAIDKVGFCGNALLHVDASQLPLAESIERTRLGADTMALDAQKVGGVRGIGALIVNDLQSIAPILQGGGQEQGLRPGTEPVALAAAFAAALTACDAQRDAFARKASQLRAALLATLTGALPGMLVNEGSRKDRGAPHILNLSFPNLDTDYAVMLLDTAGYSVATRSACETDSVEGSTAVRILSGDTLRAQSTLRISWGLETSDCDLQRFAQELIRTVQFLQETS